MLIRFAVSNFRSINDQVELLMVAADTDVVQSSYQPELGVNLVPLAALYGANASGKSNVLRSLQWLGHAVASSLRFWEDEIPIEPFAFGGGTVHPSSFELEMLIGRVHYEYYLDVDRECIQYEAVYATDGSAERACVFERDGQTLEFGDMVRRQAAITELLTPRTLVLSIASRYREPSLQAFADGIANMQFLGESLDRHRTYGWTGRTASTIDLFDDGISPQPTSFDDENVTEDVTMARRGRALSWLRMADLGIRDVRIVREPVPDKSYRGYRRIQLLHTTQSDDSALDFSQESEGTQAWFRLIGPALSALESGSVLVFDELDASLHPVLSAQLLQFFRDPQINNRGAQLLFSAHDTSLMRYLRSDEIWLTEKHDDATTVCALASFNTDRVRQSSDLATGYLHGRFGGVPNLDITQLLQSKGVTAS